MPIMLPFYSEDASATIVIDGVTYRVPLVDSDGHLQVDVLTAALASDAATATNQATMITALQLIDDLRAALDSVRTDRLNVNVYRDGASEVTSVVKQIVDDATDRVTLVTPTSDKKIRIVFAMAHTFSTTLASFELYFGAGSNIFSGSGKAIFYPRLDADVQPTFGSTWPDGGGPVGAVDEVLSIRNGANITNQGIFLVHYREE